jgi:DNA helicase-2/ATP-dependent DNA helicase PcrA
VFLQYALNLISEQKKNFISPDVCKKNDPFPAIYAEYNQQLLKQNALDFDDILFFAYRILIENPGVVRLYNSLYRYICVDEAQDLNFAQYEVIKALCGSDFKNIMLVGDEKQSIYGFNGSDSTLMTKRFVADFQPKNVCYMKTIGRQKLSLHLQIN